MANPERPFSAGSDAGKLGGRLRVAREARGVTVEVASEQSSVPIRYLRMFEEGRYPVVADPAYLTHFVRRYASYLGLDAWQASRDFIAETEPDNALRRSGKAGTEPAKETSMSRPTSTSDKGKTTGSSGGSPPPPARKGGFKFDAGPISLVGTAVTLGLFLLNLWMQRHPSEPPIPETETTASQASAPQPAPAQPAQPAAEPAKSEPAPAPPPAAAAPPPVEQAPPAVEHAPPPAAAAPPSAPAAPPSASAPSAGASAARVEPPVPPPSAEIQSTHREPPPSAPSQPHAAPPPAAKAEPGTVAQSKPAPNRSKIDATNKASEDLRKEQLERMKARAAGGAPAAGAPSTSPAPAAPQ